MKLRSLLLLLLPIQLFSQSIVSEIGANGEFVIGKSSTGVVGGPMDTTFTINPATNQVIIGERESPIKVGTLPTGNAHFIHENGSERVNIIAALGSGFSAFPKLNLYYVNGTLDVPGSIADGDVLGIINYGGYLSSSGWVTPATIKAEVNGIIAGGVPTDIIFNTTDAADNVKTMTFDSQGNLSVTGGITSQAIKAISVAPSYSCTTSDQTIIATSTSGIVSLPTLTSNENGKIITIKVGSSSVTSIQVRELTSAEIYDADENGINPDEILLDADGEYVTLQYNHSNTTWYVTSGNY
ncbi:MAG: hypothetical protein N4A46_00940 [Schleiferiaceae bacterium]|nr:hypothetical protein [Schleiferiaceae bacterium]